MSGQINFLGYSFWISDDLEESEKEQSPSKPCYGPRVLAAYCVFTNLFVGALLYGINVSRRGHPWRGRTLVALSGLILGASLFIPTLDQSSTLRFRFFLNGLVALSLYKSERPYFQRALRRGHKPAKWWLPLIWIGVTLGALFLVKTFFLR